MGSPSICSLVSQRTALYKLPVANAVSRRDVVSSGVDTTTIYFLTLLLVTLLEIVTDYSFVTSAGFNTICMLCSRTMSHPSPPFSVTFITIFYFLLFLVGSGECASSETLGCFPCATLWKP